MVLAFAGLSTMTSADPAATGASVSAKPTPAPSALADERAEVRFEADFGEVDFADEDFLAAIVDLVVSPVVRGVHRPRRPRAMNRWGGE